jgi:exodeoxyribonuclease V gamma subunit
MTGFNLFIGNRIEILAEQLAETLGDPPGDALQGEIVIVQNRSVERWISVQVAPHYGICANVRSMKPFMH